MNVERLNRLAAGIITVADVKVHARIDGYDEENALDRMCITAIREFEDYAQVALRFQAVRVTLPSWPTGKTLPLPIGPLVPPTTVTVTAGSDEFDGYTISTGLRPALHLTGPRPAGRIEVEYIAGFGDDGEDTPDDIRHALLDQIVAYYDARGTSDRKIDPFSPHFARIAARYRRVRI